MAVVNAVHGHEGEVTGLVQRTCFPDVQGAVERGATLLLGIEGLAVERVELGPDGARVAHVVTDEQAAAACPSCGVASTSVKGHARTRPRDIPYGDAPLRLVWHKRRWRCREAACGRGSFTESLPAVPARARVTTRLRGECGAGIAERFSCVLAGAAHYRVSWPVAHAAYVAHVQAALAAPLPAVAVLGIDETRRGKPKWEQDQATGRWRIAHDRWHTGVVDADGTAGLLAHIDVRTAAGVSEWLAAQPLWWRQGVTHVAIDLSASYARAVADALPDAVVVADRFHLVRLAGDMVTEVRQAVERPGRRRRPGHRDPARLHRQGGPAVAAGPARHAPRPGPDPRPPVAVLQPGRRLQLPAGAPPGRDHRGLVAGRRGRDHHRVLQRPIRGLQPARQAPGTQRLRLPQRGQSPPPHTVGLHSSTPASLSYDHRGARPSSMSRYSSP